MRTARIVGLGIVLFFFMAKAWSIKVDSLYTATVPVTTQQESERKQVAQQALEQVLIKVTGDAQVLNNPKLKPRLSSAATLVQEFSYTAQPQSNNATTTPYLLALQFDPVSVNQWLTDANVPIWGKNRPLVLAWVVDETAGHSAEILSSDASNDIKTRLQQNADQRGLPFMLPVMDMTDLNQASVKDVTDIAIPKLLDATKRYAGDAILIGHVTGDSNGLVSQWKLVLGDNKWDWSLTGKSMADIAPTLISNITQALATRFAVVATNAVQKDLIIKVTGITHYRDFNQLTGYLNHLTPVANVEITKILADNDVIVKVSLRGTQDSFNQALSIGKKLTPAPANATDTMVVYQWNP